MSDPIDIHSRGGTSLYDQIIAMADRLCEPVKDREFALTLRKQTIEASALSHVVRLADAGDERGAIALARQCLDESSRIINLLRADPSYEARLQAAAQTCGVEIDQCQA